MFASTAPDPFPVNEYSNLPGYSNTIGRSLQSSIISAPLTTKTVIVGGQSNHESGLGTSYSTVSGQAQNLNIYNGGIYAGAEPVLGCVYNAAFGGVSSINMRLADRLISQGKATRAIVVPIAVGGTTYSQWLPTASFSLFTRLSTAILRCRARGLEPDCIIWGQGETDTVNGTSAATITTQIQAIVTAVRAMNCVAPFYPGQYTISSGSLPGNTNNAAVRLGIANSVSGPLNIVLGFDADNNCTVAGGYRLADQTHFNDAGLTLAANSWQGIIFP